MIDWSFISSREGGRLLRGYVPGGGKSGVTILDGIDLGFFSQTALAQLPQDLRTKLFPYIGLTGAAAIARLAARPLAVTEAEADLIEAVRRRELQTALTTQYLRDAAHPFEQLPDAAQTVLMSVTWQYGDPWRRCPRFWNFCIARDWHGVYGELMDFGDAFPTRRKLEAAYLKHSLGL